MIYYVDEDIDETDPFVVELMKAGYNVKILNNADTAFEALIEADDIEVVILDVMLATAGGNVSRYSAKDTNDFVTTGLVLLDDLTQQYKAKGEDVIPKRVIIFSGAQQEDVKTRIENAAKKYHLQYLDKKDYDDSFSFIDKIDSIIKDY